MITVTENNVKVEFINSEIVHVELNERGLLTAQLLRELQVVSKVNNGTRVKACIISNGNAAETGSSACRICKKAERLNGEIKMAVVCNATCLITGVRCPYASSGVQSPKIFSQYSEAFGWINSKN